MTHRPRYLPVENRPLDASVVQELRRLPPPRRRKVSTRHLTLAIKNRTEGCRSTLGSFMASCNGALLLAAHGELSSVLLARLRSASERVRRVMEVDTLSARKMYHGLFVLKK